MSSILTVNCCDGSVHSVKCFDISGEGLHVYCLGGVGRAKIIVEVLVIIFLSMDIALQCLRNLRAPDRTVAAFHQCDGGAV